MSRRLSINISEETARSLRILADRNETTVTDIVRRAVFLDAYLVTAQKQGARIELVDRDGTTTSVVLLP